MKKNLDIRAEIVRAGLKNWEVGMKFGLPESQFSRLISGDLSEDVRDKILTAIEDLRLERGEQG